MKGIDIFCEIEQIDDKYIEEAQVIRRRSWKSNRNLGSMAAVACLLICVGVYLNNVSMKDGAMEMAARDEAYVEDTVAEFAMTDGFCAGTDADDAQVYMDEAETATETVNETVKETLTEVVTEEAIEVSKFFQYEFLTASDEFTYPTIKVSDLNETSLKEMNFEDLNLQFGVLLEDGRVLTVKSSGYDLNQVYEMLLQILE